MALKFRFIEAWCYPYHKPIDVCLGLMPHIQRMLHADYSVQQMYHLINDVPAYPAFVPGCIAAQVLAQQERQMVASLQLRQAGICQSITTQNHLVPYESITLQLLKGPLRQLNGGWYLRPQTAHSCQITLDLQFDLNTSWLDYLLAGFFKEIVNSMTMAFIQRAAVIYGVQHSS